MILKIIQTSIAFSQRLVNFSIMSTTHSLGLDIIIYGTWQGFIKLGRLNNKSIRHAVSKLGLKSTPTGSSKRDGSVLSIVNVISPFTETLVS
jgi:hypothetical protein